MLEDESLMPTGQHKGKRMDEVPDSDLYWMYVNNKCSKDVREYIVDNLDAIKLNMKNKPKPEL